MRRFGETGLPLDLDAWLDGYLAALTEAFGSRIRFVGLQGSAARGEATEESDIDLVVIFDTADAADIEAYRAMLDRLAHRDRVCGFFAGWEELLRWEPSDLFHLCHDTVPLYGTLDEAFAQIDADAVDRAIRTGACNLYHGCVHNMLFERDTGILPELYKSAAFVIRALVFRDTGRFCSSFRELCDAAGEEERAIVSAYIGMKRGAIPDFAAASEALFAWARKVVAQK